MAAPVLIGLVAGLIALAGITGGDSAARTPGRAFLFGLPVFVAAGATILPFGAVWWSALAMALVTVLGMWLAGRLADRVSVTQPAGAATTVAAARSAVAVLLAAIAVRWLAPLIAALAPVSAVTVAVVCISAAVVAAVFGRGRLGLTRTVFIIAIVVAVLLLVIGVALGTPGRVFNPIVHLPGPGPLGALLGLIGALLAALAHPGLAELGRTAPSSLLRGGIATALIGFASLLGLAMFAGGSLAFPSLPISVLAGYISFAPSIVGAIFAALFAAVMTVVVAASLEAALGSWSAFADDEPGGWFRFRPFALLIAGAGVLAVSLVPLSGGWILGTAGVLGALVLLLSLRAGRRAGSKAGDSDAGESETGESDGQSDAATADAPAASSSSSAKQD